MKRDDLFIYFAIGGIIAARLLVKPVTRAVWGLYAGPKFYAAVREDLTSGDPARIARLHQAYNDWPGDVQSQFNDTVRKLGLRRPW